MAIQLPNPGLGDGQTGDNEYVMWTKVKNNFSTSTHAASRMVGTSTGNIAEYSSFGLSGSGYAGKAPVIDNVQELHQQPSGFYRLRDSTAGGVYTGLPFWSFGLVVKENKFTGTPLPAEESAFTLMTGRVDSGQKLADLYMGGTNRDGVNLNPVKFYTTGNTTKDTATGFLKASSPVLHVYNDSITKIHEAEQLDITVDKKGVGHYEIHGTTGLRKNDGWFMSPPRDVHGNVLCMVDLEEKDGVVILKTYKKLFDFETVSIVHDYDNPMDIPEGVCVEFRFNDLPEEQLDEPIE